MIKSKLRKRRGRFVSYEISGHASSGTGEYEYDVVCADVSVLAITTANNLHRIAKIKPIAVMDDGYIYVELPIALSKQQDETAQLLLTALSNAMTDVTEEFPKYVQLEIEE